MKHRAACLIFLCLSLSPAAARSPAPWATPETDYLVARIPAPPAQGDAADRSDLAYVLAVQACATPQQIARAQMTDKLEIFGIFGEVLGPKFQPDNYPLTQALLQRVNATAGVVRDGLKNHYARPRPADAHTKDGVVAHVAYSPSFAYPSGHALSGWLVALVLAQLEPSEGAQLMHCAAEIGWDRVVVGVHYQTDVIASRTVAQLVFDRLMSDPDFQEQLTRVREAEWPTPRNAKDGKLPN